MQKCCLGFLNSQTLCCALMESKDMFDKLYLGMSWLLAMSSTLMNQQRILIYF